VAAARLGDGRERSLVGGLLLELDAVLVGQGLAEVGVLVVHVVPLPCVCVGLVFRDLATELVGLTGPWGGHPHPHPAG
jgi:hypothetical protein